MSAPPVQWAKGPDGKMAYQVVGDGPVDLVLIPGPRASIDVLWEQPQVERYLRRLGSFSRLILPNLRGMGPSDPISLGTPPTIEEWVSDLRWILDAAGSSTAAFLGMEGAAPIGILFAATFPDRTRALVLLNTYASMHRHDDYPFGFPPQTYDKFVDVLIAEWGSGDVLRAIAPDLAEDERYHEWFARLERASLSPSTMAVLSRTAGLLDLRGILPAIKAPTLVISHQDMPYLRLGHGRYLAEHIPNARYVERPGFWGLPWVHDVDGTLDEIQAFLTGTRGTPEVDNRVLATVLFTDIVGSTKRAAELGDRRWREVLDDHDAILRREIERYRGRPINSTGDGFIATFDGPARAIRCGLALNDAVSSLGIQIRTGLHTGEVEQRGEDVGGIAVHIAARVMSEAGPNEVLVSGAVPPLVAGSGIEFDNRGSRELKGVPGEWRLYAVKQ
jgi:class 3 adenylate cyclase